jgi:Cys-rich repeat protein
MASGWAGDLSTVEQQQRMARQESVWSMEGRDPTRSAAGANSGRVHSRLPGHSSARAGGIAVRRCLRRFAILWVLVVNGCVSTVDDFSGLQCQGDSACPSAYACVEASCSRKLDRFVCTVDSDCQPGLFCNTERNFCMQCQTDSHCPGGRCFERAYCVQCMEDGDCAAGSFCHPELYRCLTCDTPNCGSTGGRI